MIRACTSILLIAAACTTAGADYVAAILADGPVGYYRLNETAAAGDLVNSTSGDGAIYNWASGSPVANGQWWSHYATGGMASVDGVIDGDSAVQFSYTRASGRTASIPTGLPFTMECWFRAYDASATGTLVALGEAAALSDVFAVNLSNGHVQLAVRNTYTSRGASGVTPVLDSAWHHVAAVFEARPDGGVLARLYLDGETSQPEATLDSADVDYRDHVDNFAFAAQHYNARLNNNQLAKCQLDEAALYDFALGADRIAAHYATGRPPAPTADAGPDQTLRADPDNNPVSVPLDGSGSIADDSAIAAYAWSVNGAVVATGVSASTPLEVGDHVVLLTVTDAEGDFDTDWMTVTIVDGTPVPPIAHAGADQAIHDADGDGSEAVMLDGSASHSPDVDGSLVGSSWTDATDAEIATGLTATVTLARGIHTLTLTVTDNFGLTATDTCRVAVGAEQLLNLPSDRPVFPVPADIVWPETVGDPHLCLWYGDKFAAMSITIDDNILPDHAWWIQMAGAYDFTPTWFLVVSGIDAGSNPSFNGTWPDYVDLFAAGGDLQSHTMTHRSNDDVRPDEEIHYEYGQSQALINANVPGAQCLTIGYPYGNGNLDIARQYFIAGRGTYGVPNTPGKINWMKTASSSGRIDTDYLHPILYGTSGISWLNTNQWMRSWLCTHFHTVQDKPAEEARLAYVASLKHLIWWGSFGEVVRFGQERDSAEITVTDNSASRIAFEVTDRMNDLIFDHPLTVKVRIPDAWNGQSRALQAGQPTGYALAREGGRDYILVDAAPDRGTVEILPAASPGDIDGDGDVDLDDFVILKVNFGRTDAARTEGDCDGDGDVDLDDFVILKTNFGS